MNLRKVIALIGLTFMLGVLPCGCRNKSKDTSKNKAAEDELEISFGGASSAWDESFSGTVTKTIDGMSQDVSFTLRLHSDNISNGQITGQMEWPDSNAVNNIQGSLSQGKLTFEEVSSLVGSIPIGCTYEATVDTTRGQGWMTGHFDCRSATGESGAMALSRSGMAAAVAVTPVEENATSDDLLDSITDEESTEETTETTDDTSDVSSLFGGTSEPETPAPAAKPAPKPVEKPESKPAPPAKKAEPVKKPPKAAPASDDNTANDILDLIGD